MKYLKEFYICPDCGRAISGEKKKYFVCPNCGRALCPEEKLSEFADNYCGKCGCEIVSAKKEAVALTGES